MTASQPRDSSDLRVLCLNVWGCYYGENRVPRMMAMGRAVDGYDIVCLQEQFTEEDWELIVAACRASHPYFLRFVTGFYGSALAVLSKYPIVHHACQTFDVQGYAEHMEQGDFYINRGIAMCQILVPSSSGATVPLYLYNMHPHAQWEKDSQIGGHLHETYVAVRTSQMLQAADYIISTAVKSQASGAPPPRILLCGDLNAPPESPEVQIMKAYLFVKGGVFLQRAIPSTDANKSFSYENRFVNKDSSIWKLLEWREDIPVQLDHIMYSVDGMELVREGRTVLKDNDFVNGTPISDHFGVDAIVRCCEKGLFGRPPFTGPMEENTIKEAKSRLELAEQILHDGVLRHRLHRRRCQRIIASCAALAALSTTRWFAPLHKHGVLHALFCASLGALAGASLMTGQVSRNHASVVLQRWADEVHSVSLRMSHQ